MRRAYPASAGVALEGEAPDSGGVGSANRCPDLRVQMPQAHLPRDIADIGKLWLNQAYSLEACVRFDLDHAHGEKVCDEQG